MDKIDRDRENWYKKLKNKETILSYILVSKMGSLWSN